ncbi:TPA: type VI secretion system PAAR protein [Aeromonas sobria]|nr:type VI secretion system PAAR protein [Aeromonas sobria]
MSKKAATIGDIGTDHDGFPPTPIIEGSSDIIIDNKPAARVGDKLAPHAKPGSPPHDRAISTGSSTVFFNGKPAAITGSEVGCGGVIIGGSSVIIGDQAPSGGAGAMAMRSAAFTPAAESVEQGSAELAEALKGAMWPPYNPMTGEDLTDKLRAALEANHKKAIILTLADAAATLKDMAEELAAELKDKAVELKGKADNFSWEKDGTKTLKSANTVNDFGGYGAAIYKAYDLAKQFGDYGVKAEVFTSKGKEYIAITTKNNSDKVLRHTLVNGVRVKLNGHKYRTNNYKVMQLGLTPQSRASGYKGAAAVTFIISATINTNELVFNDDYHFVDWFGNVGADMFQAMVSMAAGEVVLLGIGALFGGAGVLFGAFVFVAASIVVGWVFEEWNVSEKVVSELKNAIN